MKIDFDSWGCTSSGLSLNPCFHLGCNDSTFCIQMSALVIGKEEERAKRREEEDDEELLAS